MQGAQGKTKKQKIIKNLKKSYEKRLTSGKRCAIMKASLKRATGAASLKNKKRRI
jgi:hypothetical protein